MTENINTQNGRPKTEFCFDWYQATVYDASPDELIAGLLSHFDLSSVKSITGQNSYLYGAAVSRGDTCIARVFWGGVNGNDPHIISTSEEAISVAEYLRFWFPDHRVTRVDVCEDYTGSGTWDSLSEGIQAFALKKGLKINHVGDFARGENGRTIYIGSRQSITFLRLYEKGHESGHPDKNWVRLELVVKPKKAAAREHYSKAPPDDFFGASAWSRELYTYLTSLSVPRVVSGTVRAPSDDEKAYTFLIKQYSKVLGRLFELHGSEHMIKRIKSDVEKVNGG